MSDHPAHPRSLLARWRRLTGGLPSEVAHVLTAALVCGVTTGTGYLVAGPEGAIGGFFIGLGVYALGWVVVAIVIVVKGVRWWRSGRPRS